MQRLPAGPLIALACIAAGSLAACGGGGGSATSTPPVTAASPLPTSSAGAAVNGLKLTLSIDTTKHTITQTLSNARAIVARRTPAYVSAGAAGLQIAVTSTASSPFTQTIYADISSASPLCTTANTIRTCTIALPNVALTETIVATEVDQPPAASSGGYGTGFPSNANILAVGTTSATLTGGTTAITLGLSPVWGYSYVNCVASITSNGLESATASRDYERITVTAGLAQHVLVAINAIDGSGNTNDENQANLPFVDKNGSPEPITVTSSTQSVLVAPLPAPNPSSSPPFELADLPANLSYGASISMPTESFLWQDYKFIVPLAFDGTLTGHGTLTLANNLSATAAGFPNAPQADPPLNLLLVPIGVSPLTATVSVSGTPITVVGSDYEASPTYQMYEDDCYDTNGNHLATVTPAGSIDQTTWTQPFTVTGLAPGTCTFRLKDGLTGVESPDVTLTVTS